MIDAVLNMFGILFGFLKYPLIAMAAVFAFFYVDCLFWYFLRYLKGDRVKRGSVRSLPRRSAFMRLLVDAPRQYVEDLYNRPPDFFRPQGLIVFTGRQGAGKSSAMIQYAIDLHDMYPLAKCISNTDFIYQDVPLVHWRQLVDFTNKQKGIIVIMDELQNWFSSNQSKNFPPKMLSVITQNRKNRRIILSTAQSFHLLAKAIRSQATEVRQCVTLAGVVTVVVRREPICDNDGDVKQMKYLGMYFFVHSPRLREAYDTWAVVDNLSDSGFHDNPMVKDGETAPEKVKK